MEPYLGLFGDWGEVNISGTNKFRTEVEGQRLGLFQGPGRSPSGGTVIVPEMQDELSPSADPTGVSAGDADICSPAVVSLTWATKIGLRSHGKVV